MGRACPDCDQEAPVRHIAEQRSQATTNTLPDVIGKPNPSERSAGEIKAKIQA
jgi:hypothetical protein